MRWAALLLPLLAGCAVAPGGQSSGGSAGEAGSSSTGSGGGGGAAGTAGGHTDDGGSGAVPAAPSNLVLSAAGGGIGLAWRDNSEDESGFHVFWSRGPIRPSVSQANAAANVTSLETGSLGAAGCATFYVWVTAWSSAGDSAAVTASAQVCDGKSPTWADEFDGPAIDLASWDYDTGGGGWGNGELQSYTRNPGNSYIADGHLVIKAEHVGSSYVSARLVTRGKRNFKYGRLQARIKSAGSASGATDAGVWPAFWLLPAEGVYGEWPKSGEIDIFELGGRQPNQIDGAVHWNGSSAGYTPVDYSRIETLAAPAAADYHVYTIDWTDQLIRWSVDDRQFATFDHSQPMFGREPFKQDFYIVLNVAIGGSFDRVGAPNPGQYPQALYVDWVRYYAP